jgi:tRNA (cytidine56-2'-O)-methyltransferase
LGERSRKPNVTVLRWGHRFRDQRVTTHVAMVARAFGASGFVLADVRDDEVKDVVQKISVSWGGRFDFVMEIPWKQAVNEWRHEGGLVVHLTAYGENIQTSDVMTRIKAACKDILVIVGSQKVPKSFYSPEVSDYNVAVGNQPHSEISALAVFMDRLYSGKELGNEFDDAKLRIVPQKHGKRVAES